MERDEKGCGICRDPDTSALVDAGCLGNNLKNQRYQCERPFILANVSPISDGKAVKVFVRRVAEVLRHFPNFRGRGGLS